MFCRRHVIGGIRSPWTLPVLQPKNPRTQRCSFPCTRNVRSQCERTPGQMSLAERGHFRHFLFCGAGLSASLCAHFVVILSEPSFGLKRLFEPQHREGEIWSLWLSFHRLRCWLVWRARQLSNVCTLRYQFYFEVSACFCSAKAQNTVLECLASLCTNLFFLGGMRSP